MPPPPLLRHCLGAVENHLVINLELLQLIAEQEGR